MKCSICNGDGVIYINEVDKNGYYNDAFYMKECPVCHGTGEVQTNEDWFDGLSTEEKAKAIYKIAKDDFKELRKLFYGVANDDCDAIALWLKQPHRKENEK